MAELFSSGFIAYLILALMFAELGGLAAYHGITGKGPAPASLLANLAAGGCIVLALGLLLDGFDWYWGAVLLACSMIAHLIDLGQRWAKS